MAKKKPVEEEENEDEDVDEEEEEEARRLKTLAEEKYKLSNFKSALKYSKRAQRLHPNLQGISDMVTTFNILDIASKSSSSDDSPPDWYKILEVEPFSHINSIKKQYKKLALILHPDKNTCIASEEAFKHVGEAFRVLSDKVKRKDYDLKLRIALQSQANVTPLSMVDTFWTKCSTCRLFHQFERRYMGQSLMCPSCKKSFLAVEAVVDDELDDKTRVRGKGRSAGVSSISEKNDRKESVGRSENVTRKREASDSISDFLDRMGLRSPSHKKAKKIPEMTLAEMQLEETKKRPEKTLAEMQSEAKRKAQREKGKMKEVAEKSEKIKGEQNKIEEKGNNNKEEEKKDKKEKEKEKEKVKEKEKEKEKVKEKEKEKEKVKEKEKEKGKEKEKVKEKEKEKVQENENEKKGKVNENEKVKEKEKEKVKENEKMGKANEKEMVKEKETEKVKGKERVRENEKKGKANEKEKEKEKLAAKEKKKAKGRAKAKEKEKKEKAKEKEDRLLATVSGKSKNLEVMAVEDSDFYNFDKDRMERSFKKGQVWAVYDDDDGMPRHYGLIDEVVSVNPFEVKMSWLDLQNNTDEGLICWQRSVSHISCGRFKVAKKTAIDSVNFFSHPVECERVAREVYRIYPKKGSIWALYRERDLDGDEAEPISGDNRCYDIVVFLTSYSDMHGLSMAYLEKVEGFKTIFKRREIGCHAIRWFEKDNVQLFSHQIPARKLSGKEAPSLPKDCWELDPASLSPDLLIMTGE